MFWLASLEELALSLDINQNAKINSLSSDLNCLFCYFIPFEALEKWSLCSPYTCGTMYCLSLIILIFGPGVTEIDSGMVHIERKTIASDKFIGLNGKEYVDFFLLWDSDLQTELIQRLLID